MEAQEKLLLPRISLKPIICASIIPTVKLKAKSSPVRPRRFVGEISFKNGGTIQPVEPVQMP